MGTIIIKPERDKDEYVLWSTFADEPWMLGSREEVLLELLEDSQLKEKHARPIEEERLDHTDRTSCSSRISRYSWDVDATFIYMNHALVRRSNVGKLFTELYAKTEGWEERAEALLEEIDD